MELIRNNFLTTVFYILFSYYNINSVINNIQKFPKSFVIKLHIFKYIVSQKNLKTRKLKVGQLEDMKTFICIIDTGGIGSASEQMGVSKSMVSRRLSELESRLGVTLINRTTRSSKITEVGQSYYKRSLKLIDDFTKLDTIDNSSESRLSGLIRISASISFGVEHLTPAISAFSKEHPELTFDIELSSDVVNPIEEGFDLVIRMGGLESSSLRARKISTIHYSLCASPEYLKQYGMPKTPEDLKNHDLIKFSFNKNSTWDFLDINGKQHTVNKPSKVISNNSDVVANMAIAGHGIVRIPTFMSWKAVTSGELVQILENYNSGNINAYAVYPSTRFLSPRVRVFIDFLAERFGDNPYWDSKIDY